MGSVRTQSTKLTVPLISFFDESGHASSTEFGLIQFRSLHVVFLNHGLAAYAPFVTNNFMWFNELHAKEANYGFNQSLAL
jgi:hypothetical protein